MDSVLGRGEHRWRSKSWRSLRSNGQRGLRVVRWGRALVTRSSITDSLLPLRLSNGNRVGR
jgi:hypothetical protein